MPRRVSALKGGSMRIGELMTVDVEVIKPGDTLHTAAKMMADIDAGVLAGRRE